MTCHHGWCTRTCIVMNASLRSQMTKITLGLNYQNNPESVEQYEALYCPTWIVRMSIPYVGNNGGTDFSNLKISAIKNAHGLEDWSWMKKLQRTCCFFSFLMQIICMKMIACEWECLNIMCKTCMSILRFVEMYSEFSLTDLVIIIWFM